MASVVDQDRTSKREQILIATESAILEKGVTATSIEEIAAEVGISKNGFFYHFKSKEKLVQGVLARNLQLEADWLNGLMAQAEQKTVDPLASFLVFIELLAQEMEDLPGLHPGCITSVCCYQDRWLSSEVTDLGVQLLSYWRGIILKRLELIADTYQHKLDADLDDLAVMLPALLDGTIIFSKVTKQKQVLSNQVRLYGKIVESAFSFD